MYQILKSDGLYDSGTIEIMQNYALAAAGVSVKTHAQEMVDAIEAVIEGRATQAQKQVTVGDKHIEYLTIDELMRYLDYFKAKAAKEAGSGSTDINSQKKILFQYRSV